MTRYRLELLQWFALFGGSLAWAGQHVASFAIGDAGCHVVDRRWGLPLATLQTAVCVPTILVILAAEAAAYLVYRETSAATKDSPGPAGRMHFFAQASLVGNVLMLALVALQFAGTLYHLPCHQG